MLIKDRIIGSHKGEMNGPLLICFGGIHGNEPAGVNALKRVFKMLEAEYQKNPNFQFSGQIIGLKGNIPALNEGVRYIDRDLNRIWRPDVINNIKNSEEAELSKEEIELKKILKTLDEIIQKSVSKEIIVLDIHTTTADGGIFMIPSFGKENIALASEFPVPVIIGTLDVIQGSTMHYFGPENFSPPTRAITFEAGQHEDPLSTERAVAIIVNCLKIIGCVSPKDVDHRHEEILFKYSKDVPHTTQLIEIHVIKPEDKFRMMPGFTNFQPVVKGTLLAEDRNGPIHASEDGFILMPHYQKRGEEGFFLIQDFQKLEP